MTGIVAQAPTESRWERIGPPVRLDSAGYESTPKDYEVQGLYTSNTGTVITAHSIDLTFREMVMGFWNPIRMNGSIITTALRPSMAEESVDYCDDGQLRMFPGASHWVHHEREEVTDELIRHLARNSP